MPDVVNLRPGELNTELRLVRVPATYGCSVYSAVMETTLGPGVYRPVPCISRVEPRRVGASTPYDDLCVRGVMLATVGYIHPTSLSQLPIPSDFSTPRSGWYCHYRNMEEDAALRDVVKKALEGKGVLAQIRVRTRKS